MNPDEFPFHLIEKKPRKIFGVILCFAGWIMIIVSSLLCFELLNIGKADFTAILFSVILLLGIGAGIRLQSFGRKIRFVDPISKLNIDKRSPVLFLRQFIDDDLLDMTSHTFGAGKLHRYEDALTKTLKSIGPLVAFGRPGEQWPETGAARFYVNNDEWRTAVHYFIKNANVVVIAIGSSPALRWELAEVLKTLDRAKVLFFFPYPILRKKTNRFVRQWSRMWLSKNTIKYMQIERQKGYVSFKNDTEKVLHCDFPESLGDTVFIDFDNCGKPRLLKPKRPSLFTNIMQVSFVNKYVGINFKKTLQPFLTKFEKY